MALIYASVKADSLQFLSKKIKKTATPEKRTCGREGERERERERRRERQRDKVSDRKIF